MDFSLSIHDHLNLDDVVQVKAIIGAATQADEMAPLSEHVLIHLAYGGDSADQHVLAKTRDGQIIGYLHLDPTDEVSGPVVEVVVLPDFRSNGVGTSLVKFVIERLGKSKLRLWAHGELMSAYALAKKMGFTKSRELWQMRRSLYAELPKLEIPAGAIIRPFQIGVDEDNWLDLNSKVFEKHPEQGRLDRAGLEIRINEYWFRPEGFLVAEDNSGQLTGYNWTKIHGSTESSLNSKRSHGHFEIGEIYVLGVRPEFRGTGLSTALAISGLEYLRAQGLPAAMLYVDRDNSYAIKLYESIGFAHWDTDVMFAV